MKKLFNLLQHLTPVFEYVGNKNQIHWSSWTATADGVIIMEIGWSTGGGGGYYYVKDNTANIEIAKMTTYSANGTSETRCFPVIKGHTYQVAGYAKVDGNHLNFFFYKLKLFGGGYGLTSILSRLSAIFRDWRWRHEESTETDEGYFNISQRGEGNKRGMHRLQTGELPNTQDRDGLTVACNIESNRLSIIGGGISCKDLQRLNICGLRNLREYERAGARRDNGGHGCARSTVRIPNTEIRLVLRGIGGISERRCVA